MLTQVITACLLLVYLADLARTIPRIGKPRTGLAGRAVGRPGSHLGFAAIVVLGGVALILSRTSVPAYAGWVLVAGGLLHAGAAIRVMLKGSAAPVAPIRIDRSGEK